MVIVFALAGAAACLPALVLSAPAPKPTSAAADSHWRRDIDTRLERRPRGFTDERGVVHLPLHKRRNRRSLRRRGDVHQLGLGDMADSFYEISLNIGGSQTFFQLDTGSSDLWSVATNCSTTQCSEGVQAGAPRYDPAKDTTVKTTGLPLQINYGTSIDGTYARGSTLRTTVNAAGWIVDDQAFGAIDDTNNPVAVNSAGIFGVGFPYISNIANDLFNASLRSNQSLANASPEERAQAYLASLATNGPTLTRLALNSSLAESGYSVTIQRALDPATSNAGLITLGGLPSGISNDSITYKPIFKYPAQYVVPFDFAPSLGEIPAQMEIEIDGIKVNGQTLPTPANSQFDGHTYALIDSGTTTIKAPQDFVQAVYQNVGFDQATQSVPCDAKLTISVVIGGKDFPINPVDWLGSGSTSNDTSRCGFQLLPGDPPSNGTVSSWTLGDVFMKNVLTYFYFGSADQSDPAKIGFLSTTDASAAGARFDSVLPSSLSGNLATTPFSVLSTPAPSATTSLANPISAGNPNATGSGNGLAAPSASQTSKSAGVAVRASVPALAGVCVALFAMILTA